MYERSRPWVVVYFWVFRSALGKGWSRTVAKSLGDANAVLGREGIVGG